MSDLFIEVIKDARLSPKCVLFLLQLEGKVPIGILKILTLDLKDVGELRLFLIFLQTGFLRLNDLFKRTLLCQERA